MERLRRLRQTIGFVPTMGMLHDGHLSLIRRARRENQIVVVSLFVNSLQFGPVEDFRRYPRNPRRDKSLLLRERVDYLFLPDARKFYPKGFQSFIDVSELSRVLCGRFRPGHFRGVATVVAKLFNLTKPHRAYFGAKDYQQARVIQQLVTDFNFDLKVRVLPLVRDKDGLALSSRNTYLTPSQRRQALSIFHSLEWAKAEVKRKRWGLAVIRREALKRLRKDLDRVDYVEFVEPKTLKPVRSARRGLVIAVAGWVGKTRLIDNVIITP